MHGEAWLIMGASLICKAIILRKAGGYNWKDIFI